MNRIKKRWGTKLAVVLSGTLLLFGAAAPSFAVSQETLSVNDYLLEVMNKHQGYRGSALIQEGSMERSVEGRLFFSPSLFSEIGHTDD